jgi:hypothetical protein
MRVLVVGAMLTLGVLSCIPLGTSGPASGQQLPE